jgi:hypothetical protein
MKTFHLSTESGENARVLLSEIPTTVLTPLLLNSQKQDTKTEKFHRGNKTVELTPKALVAGDPEIDFENIGRILPAASRGFRMPGEPNLRGDFEVFVTTYLPSGEEKEKKKFSKKKANTNEEVPVKMGKRIPLTEALQKFCFHNQYLLSHNDGVEFLFLQKIAKSLYENQEMATLGAGPKGQAPLVFTEGGTPTRALLFGEIQGDQYRLRILTTRQELKRPTPKTEQNLERTQNPQNPQNPLTSNTGV